MTESGHEAKSALDYFRFGCRLGASGLIGLGRRFAGAVGALIGLWREHTSSAATWMREEHERKMGLLAEARKISILKLHALRKLQRPPMTKSLVEILAGLMLDRVALAVMSFIGLLWLLAARATFVLCPPLALISLVLGTIFLGVATPTEGGAMGASGALVMAVVRRRLDWKLLKQAMESTAKLTAFVVFMAPALLSIVVLLALSLWSVVRYSFCSTLSFTHFLICSSFYHSC